MLIKDIKSTRKYGLEIETNSCPRGRSGDYQKLMPSGVEVTTDGTVSGHEFRMGPFKGNRLLEIWGQFYGAIKDDANGNNCGLHIHIDLSGVSVKSFFNLILLCGKYDPILYSAMPRHRLTGWGAIGLVDLDILSKVYEEVKKDSCVTSTNMSYIRGYYSKLLSAGGVTFTGGRAGCHFLSRHSTIEFRHHEGTKELELILPWLKICLAFVDTAVRTEFEDNVNLHSNFETMCEILNLEQDSIKYLQKRIKEFGVITPEYLEEALKKKLTYDNDKYKKCLDVGKKNFGGGLVEFKVVEEPSTVRTYIRDMKGRFAKCVESLAVQV